MIAKRRYGTYPGRTGPEIDRGTLTNGGTGCSSISISSMFLANTTHFEGPKTSNQKISRWNSKAVVTHAGTMDGIYCVYMIYIYIYIIVYYSSFWTYLPLRQSVERGIHYKKSKIMSEIVVIAICSWTSTWDVLVVNTKVPDTHVLAHSAQQPAFLTWFAPPRWAQRLSVA